MKKILALLLAVMMLFVGMSVAFAEGDGETGSAETQTPAATTDYDHPLTVSGLAAGDSVKFYKVIEWVGEDDDAVAGWKAVSPFDTILDKTALTTVLVGDNKGITSELAGRLADAAADGVDGTVVNGVATLNNDSAGMWMALITPADANTIYNPVFVAADYITSAGGAVSMGDSYKDAVAKKSTVTLTKTADNANDYNGDHAQTTAIGDTVTFTVNTQIPGYGEVYQNPHFDVVDTLTDLTLNPDSVTVTAPAGLTKGTQYTVSATTSGYRISFTAAYLKTLKAATPVTITYTAVVATTAAKAINEEDNEVYIEYSHNPTDEGDYDVKKDTTQHYTFTLDAVAAGEGSKLSGKKTSELVKIGLDAAGNPITQRTETSAITGSETWQGPLQGAEFGLWKNAECTGEPYKTQTTGEDGRMTFAGLDAGTYYLKEISAPAGFVTQSAIHTVVIAAVTETVSVTEYFKDGAWSSTNSEGAKAATYETEVLKSYTVKVDNEETATYTFANSKSTNSNEIQWETVEAVEHPFDLPNIQGTELPSTGGMGTTLLYVGGSILVLAAVILLVTKRRMGAND